MCPFGRPRWSLAMWHGPCPPNGLHFSSLKTCAHLSFVIVVIVVINQKYTCSMHALLVSSSENSCGKLVSCNCNSMRTSHCSPPTAIIEPNAGFTSELLQPSTCVRRTALQSAATRHQADTTLWAELKLCCVKSPHASHITQAYQKTHIWLQQPPRACNRLWHWNCLL